MRKLAVLESQGYMGWEGNTLKTGKWLSDKVHIRKNNIQSGQAGMSVPDNILRDEKTVWTFPPWGILVILVTFKNNICNFRYLICIYGSVYQECHKETITQNTMRVICNAIYKLHMKLIY